MLDRRVTYKRRGSYRTMSNRFRTVKTRGAKSRFSTSKGRLTAPGNTDLKPFVLLLSADSHATTRKPAKPTWSPQPLRG